jgi:plasmid stabilization system protein ParE
MTLRFTSASLVELRRAMLHYEGAQPGLGARFVDDAEVTAQRIIAAPEAWRRLSARTRRCRFRRFPYGLIYQVRGEEILVLSAMDLRRDPESWSGLL